MIEFLPIKISNTTIVVCLDKIKVYHVCYLAEKYQMTKEDSILGTKILFRDTSYIKNWILKNYNNFPLLEKYIKECLKESG